MNAQNRLHPLCVEIYAGASPRFDDIYDAFSEDVPLLRALRETPQDPEWHAEGDVHIHSTMTLDALYVELDRLNCDVSAEERAQLILGSALHDIAKAITTREREIEGRMRIIAPLHAERGRSYLAPLLLALGLEPRHLLTIVDLVGYHHDPRRLIYKGKERGDYWRLARLVNLSQLSTLCLADLKGRITADTDKLLEDHELFELMLDEYTSMLSPGSPEWIEVINEETSGLDAMTQRFVRAQGQRDAEAGIVTTPHEVISRSFVYRQRFAQLYIVCGPSGLGKTTWIREQHPDAVVISMDEVRAELTGSASNQSENRKVFQVSFERLKRLLTTSHAIVWDATSIRKVHRERLTSLAYQYRAFVRIDVLCAPPHVAFARNRSRERQVSREVISHQYERWEWPTADEAHEVGYWFIDERGRWQLTQS